ncbi:MAG: histidine kinase [Aquabacterium sp.]|nr:histidine kinase [Aquabacterium sp.]
MQNRAIDDSCVACIPRVDRFSHDGVVCSHDDAIVVVDCRLRIVMMTTPARLLFGCAGVGAIHADLTQFIPNWRPDGRAMGHEGYVHIAIGVDAHAFPLRVQVCDDEHGTKVLDPADAVNRPAYTALLLNGLDGVVMPIQSGSADALQVAINMVPLPICVFDGDKLTHANPPCLLLFGLDDVNHLIGKSIDTLLQLGSCESVRRALTLARMTGRSSPILTERIVRSDGAAREVIITAAAVPNNARNAVQMVMIDITEATCAARALAHAQQDLKTYTADVAQAREDERRRIARELHDDLGQQLVAMKMELSARCAGVDQSQPGCPVMHTMNMVDAAIDSVRRMATKLRPMILDDLGLCAAIELLVQESSRRMGVEIDLQMEGHVACVSDAVGISAYRIIQEALTNIFRHAHATQARIHLVRRDDALMLVVEDDGVGADAAFENKIGSNGLTGMRERAEMLGGYMKAECGAGGGFKVQVCLPDTLILNDPEF